MKVKFEKTLSHNKNTHWYQCIDCTAKKDEDIVAAAFYATAPDTKYKVYIVNRFVNENSFDDKVLVAEGTLEDAGYYTIDFNQEISVKAGQKYAVVVYVSTPGATHPMAIEYDSGDKFLDNIILDDGEGYISYSGNQFINVKEKQECNLCIKAFTKDR